MTTRWAHLPNAALIDQLMVHTARDTAWAAAGAAAGAAAWITAWDAARITAWNTAQDAAWDAARGAVWVAAWNVTWNTVWGAARSAAWDAAAALVTYDDCGWMLGPNTSSDVLRGLIRINQTPAATLLLVYKIFLESIHDPNK